MKKYLEISNRKIGPDFDPVIIAEIGINHGGSLDVAKQMVDAAHRAGVEIIKHQTHIIDDEMSLEAKNIIPGHTSNSIYEIMQECSLNEEEEYELMQYTKEKKMIFISSPFSRAAVDRIVKFDMPAIKIGSGECNNLPLIEHIAKIKKPVILSTGMNDIKSIKRTVSIFKEHETPYALLHTTNVYPTPYNLVRLGALEELKKEFKDVVFGLSDHTTTNHACFAALALGASIVERHFTDSMSRIGPDIVCSMDENECKNLIEGSKIIHSMLGGKKTAAEEEQATINFAYASVVSIKAIRKGEKFTEKNIWVKRPGTGEILASEYKNILGKYANNNISENTQLKIKDIKK